jgi:hypothetical protein
MSAVEFKFKSIWFIKVEKKARSISRDWIDIVIWILRLTVLVVNRRVSNIHKTFSEHLCLASNTHQSFWTNAYLVLNHFLIQFYIQRIICLHLKVKQTSVCRLRNSSVLIIYGFRDRGLIIIKFFVIFILFGLVLLIFRFRIDFLSK